MGVKDLRMAMAEHFHEMALNNAWSNRRLHDACAKLSDAAFAASRVSFFPSLRATLNHILTVDWYYIEALEGGGRGYAIFDNEIPFPRFADLAEAQQASDRKLVQFCAGLRDSDLARQVLLDRAERGVKQETVATVLPHLFIHQIHHRGQAHAMLAGTTVAPPQLDEFFLFEDRAATVPELAAIGLKRR
jgi:uncharacterized damage-inducible protein DinB